jgi:hypothetical protein
MITRRLGIAALVLLPFALYFLIGHMIARRPVSVDTGIVRNAAAERVALRALAAQLLLHPRAVEVKIVWQHAEAADPSYTGSLSFNRDASEVRFLPHNRKRLLSKTCTVGGERGVAYSAEEGEIVGTCGQPF